jgi:hypothetical protein
MYIDSSELEPLDVLLFGDDCKGSKFIRYATASSYSHAGIVTTEDTIFEAVPEGLSHRPYTLSLRHQPSAFVSGEELRMLRHPLVSLFSDLRRESLLADARRTFHELEGKRYSSFESFAAHGRQPWMTSIATSFPNLLRFFLHGLNEAHEWMSSVKDRGDLSLKYFESQLSDGDLGRRLYCSETVEFVFEELGLPLRRASVGCGDLTPGDLANRDRALLVSVASVIPGMPSLQEHNNSTLINEVLKNCDEAVEALAAVFEARRRVPASERIEAITLNEPLGSEFWSLKMFAGSVQSSANRMMMLLHNLIDLNRSPASRRSPFWLEWVEVASAFVNREKDLIPASSVWNELTGKNPHAAGQRLIENLKLISLRTTSLYEQAQRLLVMSLRDG